MSLLLIVIHVIVCIALIMIVLLQTGKGADMGAAFGGGASQTLFGSTGASTFLSKATTAAAIIFMITSLTLAYMSSNKTGSSIMQNVETPVEQQAAPAAPDAGSTTAAPATQAAPAETPQQPEQNTTK
jgi:preprotein translocase subunit SecG